MHIRFNLPLLVDPHLVHEAGTVTFSNGPSTGSGPKRVCGWLGLVAQSRYSGFRFILYANLGLCWLKVFSMVTFQSFCCQHKHPKSLILTTQTTISAITQQKEKA